MLTAQSQNVTFYRRSTGYENHAPALLGSGEAYIRLEALSSLTAPQNASRKAMDLHLVALTDPDHAVRYQAALRLVDATLADTGCFSRSGGAIALDEGCAFDQFVRFCLNPPIVLEVDSDPRLGRGKTTRYDSRHALAATRVMVLRALQSRKTDLGPLRGYLQQEVVRLTSAPEFFAFAQEFFDKARDGGEPRNNLLRLSLGELPQTFKDDAFSPLARLMLLCVAGYTQSTTWTAQSQDRLPYSSIVRGCERALQDLEALVPEFAGLSQCLRNPVLQTSLSCSAQHKGQCDSSVEPTQGVLGRVAQIAAALRTRLVQLWR